MASTQPTKTVHNQWLITMHGNLTNIYKDGFHPLCRATLQKTKDSGLTLVLSFALSREAGYSIGLQSRLLSTVLFVLWTLTFPRLIMGCYMLVKLLPVASSPWPTRSASFLFELWPGRLGSPPMKIIRFNYIQIQTPLQTTTTLQLSVSVTMPGVLRISGVQ